MIKRLSRGSPLLLATHNADKAREMASVLSQYDVGVVTAATLGLPEPDEAVDSFWDNARRKACAAAVAAGRPALADDSGFCVAALGGAPGVRSARWAGPERDFSAAIRRVEQEMGRSSDRRAWFVCVLCLAWTGERVMSFCGQVHGHVRFPPTGGSGFGYDPIFVPLGTNRRYAELTPANKQADSHRTRAMAQFCAACLL